MIPRQPAFEQRELENRWNTIQALLRSRDVDLLVTFSPHNVYYLTGMDSENLFDYQCVILPANGGPPILVIFDFERGRAENSAADCEVRSYGVFDDPITFTAKIIAETRHSRYALDRSSLGVARYERLLAELGDVAVVDAYGFVEGARLIKSEAELSYIERAAELTDIGIAAGLEAIGAGVEDRRVAAAIMEAMYRSGSDTTCWGPIVAAGYRAGVAHSSFNGHVISPGETVFLELTGQVNRYTSPLMRTAVIGKGSRQIRLVETAVRSALEAIVTTAAPGVPANEVAARGLEALAPILSGHVFHHYFGYPIGLGYPPTWIENLGYFLRADNDQPLAQGMVFHLPMSIRKYGEYAVNLSHTIVVEEHGARVLGNSAASLTQR